MAKRWPPASQEERLWWNQPHSHPDLGLLASKSEKGILPLKPPTLECSVMTAWPLTYSFNSTLSLKKKKTFFLKKFYLFTAACRLSLLAARGATLSLVVVPGLLIAVASLIVEHRTCGLQQLWHSGLVALQHVESPGTKDRTHVACICRWNPYRWTTREVPTLSFYRGNHV